MGNAKASGERALRQPRILSEFPEFRAKRPVFRRMNRLFHCFHYGNVLECAQNRYIQMLTLPKNWRIVTSGAVVVDLLAQIQDPVARQEVACHLVAASLDLLVTTWPRRERRRLHVEPLSNAAWRISTLYYTFLGDDDDVALAKCIELCRTTELTVVLFTAHDSLKRELLTSVLGGRAPNVWALDSFVSWRTMTATIDQRWPRGRALLEFLRRYNRRLSAVGRGPSIGIQLPTDL